MDTWGILGIEATSDITEIKTAYAAKAKQWHPEEHPEEFKRLQMAYHTAVQIAKGKKEQVIEIDLQDYFGKNNEDEILVDNNCIHNDFANRDALIEKNKEYEKEDYDYNEIHKVDIKEQFFLEFRCIAWNPYLINHLLCWKYFLSQNPYQELYLTKDFCENFANAVNDIKGWKRKTLRFFRKWLEMQQEISAEAKDCKWEIKKAGWVEKFLIAGDYIPEEQKYYHEILLTLMEKTNNKSKLNCEEDLAEYLFIYFSYAFENIDKIEQMYRENIRQKVSNSKQLIILIFGLYILIGLLCLIPDKADSSKKKQGTTNWEEELYKNRIEAIKEYQKEHQQEEYQSEEIEYRKKNLTITNELLKELGIEPETRFPMESEK